MAPDPAPTTIHDLAPPGDLLAEALAERGMSNADLARRAGLSEKHVSQLINAKATLSMDVALNLERVLNIPASLWHIMEFNYRRELKLREEKTRRPAFATWMRRFPIRDMINCGYIDDPGRDVASRVDALLAFFGVATPAAWKAEWAFATARFRKSPAFDPSRYAITAWLRRGQVEAGLIRCAPYCEDTFRQVLARSRDLTTAPPEVFQPQLVERCSAAGVAVVLVPSLPGLAISGATRWMAPDKAVILLSLRHRSDDQLWFSFFHEACHVLEHKTNAIYIDASGDSDGDAAEQMANRFARDTLIPPKRYAAFVASEALSLDAISSFAASVGVSPGIVVGRLQFDGHLPYTHGNGLKRRFRWGFEC